MVNIVEIDGGNFGQFLGGIVGVHRECFPRDCFREDMRYEWIDSCFRTKPRSVYYVADDKGVRGYVLFEEKGGFRKEAVVELSQIGVLSANRERRIATKLIRDGLRQFHETYILGTGRELSEVHVDTGLENSGAQELYAKVLGALPQVNFPMYGRRELRMVGDRSRLEEALEWLRG